MSLHYKVILCLVCLLVSFGFGRYSAQKPTITSTVVTKTDTDTHEHEATHETIVTTKAPTGVVTTTETIDTAVQTNTTQDSVSKDQTVVIPPKTSTLNLSALVGTDPLNSFKPLYGISVSKQFIGPITIGLWGLTNSTVGVSVGINF